MRFSWRRAIIAILVLLLVLISSYASLFAWDASGGHVPRWGVTFSQPHAQWLGLDWRKTYTALLDDLQIRRLRLSAYWNWMEWPDDQWHFEDLDWQLDEATKRGATVILAVGRRLPRWPECHVSEWAHALPEERQREEVLEYIHVVVERYRNHPALAMWQVENEPLLAVFGECPPPDHAFLEREIALVRELDATHPILVTDSGELSPWMRTAALGDQLGTTFYRIVWNSMFGYWRYDHVIPPALYRLKAMVAGKPIDRMMIAELQAEPWVPKGTLQETPVEELRRSMDREQFARNIRAAQRSGIPEAILWGAEYWYWLRERHRDPSLWDAARAVFREELTIR